MKRIHSIVLLATALVTAYSCTDFQEEDVPEGLTVDTNELTYSPEGGNLSMSIRSGLKWDVSVKPEWVSVQSVSNASNPYQWGVNIAAVPNDYFDREGMLVIKSGSETANISVNQAGKRGKYVAVESVSISSRTLTLTEGETTTLTPVFNPSNASIKTVTWKSLDPSIVSVDENGTVTALSEGITTIRVTTDDGTKTADCTVTVKAKVIPVTGVSLNKTSLTLTEGDFETLIATITPSNATDKSITWSSSNSNVATVSSSGVVTALQPGTTTITVTTTDGSKKATCSVVVDARIISVTGVSLDESDISIWEGESYTLTATVSPSNATNRSVTWSSSNTSVATVSSSGVVTAKKGGITTITVTTNDGGKKATCSIEVMVKVTGVSLDKTSLTMTEGDTETLTATVTPTNAADKSVTWSSSNTSVATVSSSGVVTAKTAGNATITVKTNDGNKTAVCSVTVKAKIIAVTGVNLNMTTLTLSVGDTQTLTATVSPSNATDKSVTWSSDNQTVATVTTAGVVLANAVGTAVISVTTNDGAKTASCAVTVKPRVSSVTLDNTEISLQVGSTQTLTATVLPADALDKSVSWSSNNTSVATVSSSGVVTAKAVGNATITVKTSDGGKTATCSVTVTPVSVTGVSLNKYSITMYENDSETLIVTVSPSNASNKTVYWTSSNSAVASVSSYGQVTARAAGTADITVTTEDGGKTATCSVTVKSDPYGAVDLGLSVKWSSFNYGASSVTATGGYYMWGDPTGTGVPIEFTPPSVNSISGTQYDIVRRNWGGNWRIPTRAEINELYSNCTWTKTTLNGVSVLKVTGPNGASIYLPFTGYGMPDDGPIGTVTVTDKSNAYMMSAESYGDSYGRFVYVYYFTPSGSRSSVSYNASFVKFPIRPVR